MHSCSPSNYMVQFCSVSHIFLFFCCLVFVEMRFPKLETSIVLTVFKRHHESIWQRWTHGAFAANSSPKLILWIYNLQLKKLLSGEVSRMDAISPYLMHGETETRKNDEKLDSLCIHIVILVPKTLTTSHKLLYFHHLSSHAEAPTKAFLQVRYRCEIFNNVQGLPHDPIRRYTVGFTFHWCHRYIFKSVYPSKPDSHTGYTVSIVTSGLSFDCILLQNKSAGFWMKHQLASWECPPIHTLYSFFAKLGGIKCCSPVFAWYCSSVSLCPGFICTFYWPLVMQWHTTCKTLSLPSHA